MNYEPIIYFVITIVLVAIGFKIAGAITRDR